jgi:hypothetical protein
MNQDTLETGSMASVIHSLSTRLQAHYRPLHGPLWPGIGQQVREAGTPVCMAKADLMARARLAECVQKEGDEGTFVGTGN